MEIINTKESAICLPSIKKGDAGIVVGLTGDVAMQNRLRELGLYEDSEVRVLHCNGSVVCQVRDSRFGIDRQIAENVMVMPFKR